MWMSVGAIDASIGRIVHCMTSPKPDCSFIVSADSRATECSCLADQPDLEPIEDRRHRVLTPRLDSKLRTFNHGCDNSVPNDPKPAHAGILALKLRSPQPLSVCIRVRLWLKILAVRPASPLHNLISATQTRLIAY
jgi:hypothetical protein